MSSNSTNTILQSAIKLTFFVFQAPKNHVSYNNLEIFRKNL